MFIKTFKDKKKKRMDRIVLYKLWCSDGVTSLEIDIGVIKKTDQPIKPKKPKKN
jgi:hypothetical protein